MNTLKKYPPTKFHSTKAKDAFKIATDTKFANLYLTQCPQLDIILAPFFNLFQQTSKQQFYGHFAKFNPLYEILTQKKQQACRLVFNASDAYISPICYKQKQLTHNVVPTWNYCASQFKGKISILPESQLYGLLQKQVQIFESEVGSQWRLKDSSVEYVDKLKKGIFGVKIQVSEWKAHMKLSQDKANTEMDGIRLWSQIRVKEDKNILDWMNEFK